MEATEKIKGEEIFLGKISIFQHVLFLLILIFLIIIKNMSYYLFHTAAEIYSCIIAGGIFMVAVNTYKISKNNFFLFLGIGYSFISIIDIFHLAAYGDISLYLFTKFDIDTKLWVAGRGLELITILISFVFIIKNNKSLNIFIIVIFYSVVVSFIITDVFYLNKFMPTLRTKETGITNVKIYLEYILSTGFLLCCYIFFKLRKNVDSKLFLYLEIAFILKVFSELFFTLYLNVTDFQNMMGHILKVMSYYFIYMGIIVNGFQRPLDMINYNLSKADIAIKEKEKQRLYMEEIIKQNELCYDWIIDNSGNGIAIILNRRVVYANLTTVNILRAKDLNDLTGRNIFEFVNDNSIQLIRFSNHKQNKFNEIKILNLNNEIIEAEFSINNITYRRKSAYLVILKDVSYKNEIKSLKNELSESEEQLNKTHEYNKMLTEFFSNISHELKTPINVILSAVQLLMLQNIDKDGYYDEKLNGLLNVIKQNGYRLIRLVNNLLDMSKIDSGYLKLEIRNYNIVNIVEEITLSVADYIKSKGVALIFDTDKEEKIMAVDADKIERIILNLLSNAVKFTEVGDEILVKIYDYEDYINISIKDSGIGIPEDKLQMIFDRFAQVDKTLTRNKEGSGIGLSLVKTLTDMHGGKISVNSKVGEGSEFIIGLPVKLVEQTETESNNFYESKIDKILIEFSDIYS